MVNDIKKTVLHVKEVDNDIFYLKNRLIEHCDWLKKEVECIKQKVINDNFLNSLGELQGQALELDRLIITLRVTQEVKEQMLKGD